MIRLTIQAAIEAGFVSVRETPCLTHPNAPGLLFRVMSAEDDLTLLPGICRVGATTAMVVSGSHLPATKLKRVRLERFINADSAGFPVSKTWNGPLDGYPPDLYHSVIELRAGSGTVSAIEDYALSPILGVLCGKANISGGFGLLGGFPTLGPPTFSSTAFPEGSVEVGTMLLIEPRVDAASMLKLVGDAVVVLADALPPEARQQWLNAAVAFVDTHRLNPSLRQSVASLYRMGEFWCQDVKVDGSMPWFVANRTGVVLGAAEPTMPLFQRASHPAVSTTGDTVTVLVDGPMVATNQVMPAAVMGLFAHILLALPAAPVLTGTVRLGPDSSTVPIDAGDLQSSKTKLAGIGNSEPKHRLRDAVGAHALIIDAISYADSQIGDFPPSYVYDWTTP